MQSEDPPIAPFPPPYRRMTLTSNDFVSSAGTHWSSHPEMSLSVGSRDNGRIRSGKDPGDLISPSAFFYISSIELGVNAREGSVPCTASNGISKYDTDEAIFCSVIKI